MHTIGMDTYGLIADGVAAAEGQLQGRVGPFRWWIRGKTAAGVGNPASPGAGKRRSNRILAHIRSPRDNRHYRAAFSRRWGGTPPPAPEVRTVQDKTWDTTPADFQDFTTVSKATS